MIVVKIELHSAITGKVSEIGRMIIANDGAGSRTRGNYDVKIGRRGVASNEATWNRPVRMARVENYPRKAYAVWELIRRALNAVYGKGPKEAAANVCEHGDHLAPAGQRFCSEACKQCEAGVAPCSVECATDDEVAS